MLKNIINESGGNDMTKHLIRSFTIVLVLILFFIVPVSANLTAFDASVKGNTIVSTSE